MTDLYFQRFCVPWLRQPTVWPDWAVFISSWLQIFKSSPNLWLFRKKHFLSNYFLATICAILFQHLVILFTTIGQQFGLFYVSTFGHTGNQLYFNTLFLAFWQGLCIDQLIFACTHCSKPITCFFNWHRARAVWCLPKMEKLGNWSVGNFLLQ